MTIKSKVTFFLSILFAVVIGNSFFTYKLEQYSQEKVSSINHANKVIINMKEYLMSMRDAETGQRGYLLTQNPKYLEPYHNGIANAKDISNTLMKLTLNDESKALLKEIKQLEILKYQELQRTIKLANEDKLQEALTIVNDDSGKRIMDNIRKKSAKFLDKEMDLLNDNKMEFTILRTRIITLISVSVTFFIMMSLFTILFLNRTLFEPMKLLLNSTHKVENGEQIDIQDITTQDEMGYLLSSFYKMNEKVIQRENCLTHIAHHDELTDLKNRVNLYSSMDTAIVKAKKTNKKIAILFLDLDKFKQINDSLGHEAGDLLLVEASKIFSTNIRSTDSVFRLGGDEFLILLEDITDVSQVDKVIRKIFDAIKTPIEYKDKKMQISVSIGVAIFPEDGTSPDELVKASDVAMYVAKNDNDIKYKYFDTSMLKS